MKHNATLPDVIAAAGILVELVAIFTGTPRKQLAESILKHVAAQEG